MIKLLDFIICDDVRNEVGNKVSLMGVYTSTFEVGGPTIKWPFQTSLGFFIRLQREDGESIGDGFEFHVLRSGETKIRLDGKILSSTPGIPFVIHFNVRPFIIKEPGVLDFELRFTNLPIPITIPLSSLSVVGAHQAK